MDCYNLDSEMKYEFVEGDTKTLDNGIVVKRISALDSYDFSEHADKTYRPLGGYLESEKNLSHNGNCWVYDTDIVYGDFKLTNNNIIVNNQLKLSNMINLNLNTATIPTLTEITLNNCQNIKFDNISNVSSLYINNYNIFSCKDIPSNIRVVRFYNIKNLTHLPHLLKLHNLKIDNKILKQYFAKVLFMYNKKYVWVNRTRKEIFKMMLEFQDILIESDQFSENEYCI